MNVSVLWIPFAFVAGMLSFLSPCVLPLVPIYLGHLVGTTSVGTQQRSTVIAHALTFVAGFSVVFVALGALAGVLNALLPWGYRDLAAQVGGVILIALGLYLGGFVRLPWLDREQRFELPAKRGVTYPTSFLVGMIFAAGWTPCIGPILGGILSLALATSAQNVAMAAFLLVCYSAGLAVPFLVAAAAWQAVAPRLRQLGRYSGVISRLSGLLLIIMGLVLLTGSLATLNRLAGQSGLLSTFDQTVLGIERWLTEQFAR